MPARAGETATAGFSIGRKHIRRARRRGPGAHLRRVTRRVYRRATHLRAGRVLAAVRAARAARGVAHCAGQELARRLVAARRIDAHAWIALLPVLDDAVAAHIKGDGVDAWIRVLQTGRVDAVFRPGLHERANVPNTAGRKVHLIGSGVRIHDVGSVGIT